MKSVAKAAQLDIRIESAGTEGYHVGDRPDSRMMNAAAKRGFSLESRGRQVTATDLARGSYDLVVAMDHANMRRLRSIASTGTDNVRLFSDFLDEAWPEEVPDPYYGGDAGFEQVLDMLEAGCPRLLESLTNNQKEDDA
ncbi:low molecular weight phosphotyrosine protein phosphatase [Rhodopirellula sp. ICT_H3.1]|uniref:Low molecular weight phosphotyrosine protein phosphatase n=2 Tax=Aporhodopirellula aestuarii TaxID=2950107 RepID=A0ABT0U1P1_9BACT|nr:low molecular weight phosphotyrosine protein phosphatase [Aporhodopirellula aestuarii]